MAGCNPEAAGSRLRAGGTVAYPHSGPVDTKLRMHFVIALPPHRRGEIVVAAETRAWAEGEAIVFPPNYMHETYVHPDDNRRAPPTRAHAACRHALCHDRGSPRAKLPAS